MAVGADLGNMSEAWWCPSVVVPGEEYDGKPAQPRRFRDPLAAALDHRQSAGRALRERSAQLQRHDEAFFAFDPVSYERTNLPAWLILDHQFRERYALVTAMPGMPTPRWIESAQSLDELARKIGVDARGSRAPSNASTVSLARASTPNFRRGESVYDHFYGDPEHKPNPNLGALEKPPFYALEVHPGAIGTKGGAKVDRECAGAARRRHADRGPLRRRQRDGRHHRSGLPRRGRHDRRRDDVRDDRGKTRRRTAGVSAAGR